MARILLVDQSSPERALIRMTLLVSGHQVVEASSAAQAVEAIERTQVDLALVDPVLPDSSQYEVIDRLRTVPGRALTPVIVLLQEETEETVRDAALAGATDHVRKPFDAHELRDVVTRAIAAPEEMAAHEEMLDVRRRVYLDVVELQDEVRAAT